MYCKQVNKLDKIFQQFAIYMTLNIILLFTTHTTVQFYCLFISHILYIGHETIRINYEPSNNFVRGQCPLIIGQLVTTLCQVCEKFFKKCRNTPVYITK